MNAMLPYFGTRVLDNGASKLVDEFSSKCTSQTRNTMDNSRYHFPRDSCK